MTLQDVVVLIVGGGLGGLLVIAFIAVIGGFTVRRVEDHPTCTRDYCNGWRHAACGSGYCANHCDTWCSGKCIDPRPLPVGAPGHKPTVIKGGRA